VVTSQPACNGAGSCLPSGSRNCDPYKCDDSGCKTTCVTDADCVAGVPCIDSRCGGISDAGTDSGVEAGTDAGPGEVDASADAPGSGARAGSSSGGSGGRADAGVTDAGGGGARPGGGAAEDEGCGCRLVGERNSGQGALWVALIALMLGRRRRRRDPG
jgi:MYXO-CTERM domain-containing protein